MRLSNRFKGFIYKLFLIFVTKSEFISLLVLLAAASNRINVFNFILLIFFFIFSFAGPNFRIKYWKVLILYNAFHIVCLYSFMLFNTDFNQKDFFGFSENPIFTMIGISTPYVTNNIRHMNIFIEKLCVLIALLVQ